MASDASPFGPLMPGFEFLQGLVKNAGAAAPGIGQWVAPTLNPEEIQKRIDELKTVQFWLEQNARMIGATIQALEVQRMTLSTLKTMNVQMTDLRDALTIRMTPGAAPAPSPTPAPTPAPQRSPFAMPSMTPPAVAPKAGGGAQAGERAAAAPAESPGDSAAAAPGTVDPMQWWGALTKQFSELAASAMRDTAAGAKHLAASMAQSTASGGVQAPVGEAPAAKEDAARKSSPGRSDPA